MKIIMLFVLLPILLSLSPQKIIIVTEEWAPYVINNGGAEPTGFDYEVAKTVFDEIGYQIELQFYPWKRCIEMVKLHKADAILDIGHDKGREDFLFFPEEHISESSSVLFYLSETNFKYNSLSDLTGLTVGTSLGYKYNEDFDNSTLFKREPVKDHETNFRKLLAGRIDLIIVNKNVGLFIAKEMRILEKVTFAPKAITGGKIFLAFSTKPENLPLSISFSKELKKFKESKKYKAILSKYGQ